MTLKIGLTTRS